MSRRPMITFHGKQNIPSPRGHTNSISHQARLPKKKTHTLCNMIATNTITSTSVFDVVTAAPRATPSATEKKGHHQRST